MIRQTCYSSQCECLLESSQKCIYLLDRFHRMVLVRPKCHSGSDCVLDFAARNSFFLDRQVSPVFSWPNLPYLCETCPIKVWSIFSRDYVSYSIALLFPDQRLDYLIYYLRVYTLAHSCLIKVQSIFSNPYLLFTCLHTCPFMPDQSPIYF